MATVITTDAKSQLRYRVVHEEKIVKEIDNYLAASNPEDKYVPLVLAKYWNFLTDNALDWRTVGMLKLIDFLCAYQLGIYIDPPVYKFFVPNSSAVPKQDIAKAIAIILDFYRFYASDFPSLSLYSEDAFEKKLINISTLVEEDFAPILQLDAILKDCSTSRDRLILLLAVQFGLSCKEISDLTIGSIKINCDCREVSVLYRCGSAISHEHGRWRSREIPLLTSTPNKDYRVFTEAFDRYLELEDCRKNKGPSSKLLVKYGQDLEPRDIYSFYAMLRSCGHDRVRANLLRYQFILNAINYGLHVEYIRRAAGIISLDAARRHVAKAIDY